MVLYSRIKQANPVTGSTLLPKVFALCNFVVNANMHKGMFQVIKYEVRIQAENKLQDMVFL